MTFDADFTLENHGSIWLVRPISDPCREWLKEHTDGTWFAGALAVEPRFAEGLVAGLEDDGFILDRDH